MGSKPDQYSSFELSEEACELCEVCNKKKSSNSEEIKKEGE